MSDKVFKKNILSSNSSLKHVCLPKWHVGPDGFALISKVSLSQSVSKSTKFK